MVFPRMDDDGFANDVPIGTGVDVPKVCRPLNISCAIAADRNVAEIAKME